MELLIQCGMNVNISNKYGNTLLFKYIFNLEIVLLQHGHDINRQNDRGDTLLHDSVRYGRSLDTIKFILEHEIDYTIRNHQNQTVKELAEDNIKYIQNKFCGIHSVSRHH
jgi:ankyrin repeat protein